MNNNEYNTEEALLKEALTDAKTDQEIGMPDVEAELRKFHAQHDRQQFRKAAPSFQLRRIAAILLVVLLLGGIACASYMYSISEIPTQDIETNRIDEIPVAQTESPQPMVTDTIPSLTYQKATLQQIVEDLSKYYGLDAPVFENPKSRDIKMHITFDRDGKIHDALNKLNHFGSIQFQLKDNHIIVK